MFRRMLPLLLVLGISTSMAQNHPDGIITSRSNPVAVNNPDTGSKTLIYEELFFGPSITGRLWSQQSFDGGSTWSIPQAVSLGPTRAAQIVTSLQGGASLVLRAGGGYVLFHHYGAGTPSNIWRTPGSDGSAFVDSTEVDLGWPEAGNQPGSGFPSVVLDGPASMTMLYQRFAADGSSPVGVYLARSLDDGLSWSPGRTLVTTDAHLGARSMLAYRSSDHRYVATYERQWAAEDNRVMVKVTDNVDDWSAPPVLEVPGNNAAPSLVVMPDGAFVLVYGRQIGGRSDLFARRSTDGIVWAEEIRLTDSSGYDETPFALAGSSPGVVEMYWASTPDVSPTYTSIVRNGAVVVLDPVYASGFDD